MEAADAWSLVNCVGMSTDDGRLSGFVADEGLSLCLCCVQVGTRIWLKVEHVAAMAADDAESGAARAIQAVTDSSSLYCDGQTHMY